MNLYVRLLIVLIRARFGAALDALDTARTPFRVWPHDCDVNLHMNNGRYATLMDLGRVDLMARAGFLGALRSERMHPVVTAQHLTYRRSLEPFRRFVLETRVLGWDERVIMLEQSFVHRGRIAARGYVQALFLDANGRVPNDRIMSLLGVNEHVPIPGEIAALFPATAKIVD